MSAQHPNHKAKTASSTSASSVKGKTSSSKMNESVVSSRYKVSGSDAAVRRPSCHDICKFGVQYSHSLSHSPQNSKEKAGAPRKASATTAPACASQKSASSANKQKQSCPTDRSARRCRSIGRDSSKSKSDEEREKRLGSANRAVMFRSLSSVRSNSKSNGSSSASSEADAKCGASGDDCEYSLPPPTEDSVALADSGCSAKSSRARRRWGECCTRILAMENDQEEDEEEDIDAENCITENVTENGEKEEKVNLNRSNNVNRVKALVGAFESLISVAGSSSSSSSSSASASTSKPCLIRQTCH